MPPSIFIPRTRLKDSYNLIEETFGTPFILKDIHGYKGKLNYLINDHASFDKALVEADELEAELVAQQNIDNDGDYRLLVFGNKVYMVIYRSRADSSTHLNNIYRWSFKMLSSDDLPDEVVKEALVSARALDRQVAGVDMVKDTKDNKWYCLELNEGPQISSGALIEEKQAAFAEFLEDYLN